jgi:hypothetical protein
MLSNPLHPLEVDAMSNQIIHPEGQHEAESGSSSPVPEKWIPWVVVILVVGLIFVGFAIPAGTIR